MNTRVTVLMYHAILGAERDHLGTDLHYAVSKAQYMRHISYLTQTGRRITSVARLLEQPGEGGPRVAFTFDDGHISNGHAAELLAAHDASADFFVNPALVGRAHNLGWADLREMAEAGMSIQSHGQHHYHFDQLTPQQAKAELVDSKREIEDRLGRPVTLLAAPGGRTVPSLFAWAAEAGYKAVCTSRASLWRQGEKGLDIPRLAVLKSTSEAQLRRWVDQDPLELLVCGTRYHVLRGAKQLLGESAYKRLRTSLLRPGAGRPA